MRTFFYLIVFLFIGQTLFAYGKSFVVSQIAGIKVRKNIWMEANTTLGKYDILLDNDGLYLFNDIDTKKFKIGGSAYILIRKNIVITFNYIFEKKLLYGTSSSGTLFNQHSITSSIVWNL